MTATTTVPPAPTSEIDPDRVMAFVGKAIGDFGALVNGALVVIGDRLGLYRAMAGAGPVTALDLAERTGTTERYIREWLDAQASGGYLTYDGEGRYSLPAEHAIALTDENSPAFVIGGFQLGLASAKSADRLTEAFQTGDGIGWGDHDADLFPGCERLFGPSYRTFLASTWIPALPAFRRSSDSTRTEARSMRPGPQPPRQGWATGSGSRWRPHRSSPARTTWSRSATPCTTWATQSVPRPGLAPRWPTAARSWSSSRSPATGSRTTRTR
jgi:hypothetical protein